MILQAYDFARAEQAHPAACCRWAAPTSGGNHRQRPSTSAAAMSNVAAVRAETAPAGSRQARGAERWAKTAAGRGCGSNADLGEPILRLNLATNWRNTEDGRLSRASSSLFTKPAARRDSRGWAALQGSEINEGEEGAGKPKATYRDGCNGRPPAADEGVQPPARKNLRGKATPRRKPARRLKLPAPKMQSLGVLSAFVRAGLASSKRRCAGARSKGGGLRGQPNVARQPTRRWTLTQANLTPEGVVKAVGLAASGNVLIKPI